MTSLEIVVACDAARGIARGDELPWHLPGDLRHFRLVTSQPRVPGRTNAVIMGRRTWETIPPRFQPLPGRLNVVLTRQPAYAAPAGVLVRPELQQGIDAARNAGVDRLLIVGGAMIYAAALARRDCRRAFITHIEGEFDCDTFMPPLDDSWTLTAESPVYTENAVRYRFSVYDRLS